MFNKKSLFVFVCSIFILYLGSRSRPSHHQLLICNGLDVCLSSLHKIPWPGDERLLPGVLYIQCLDGTHYINFPWLQQQEG